MNKINFIIICLLILLSIFTLAFQATLIALQIVNNNFYPITINNQLDSVIATIKSCSTINYPQIKFINHTTYLKFSTYCIIIGSALNLINLVLLLIYLKILYKADEESEMNEIKKLKIINGLFSFTSAIPIINYFGYMLSFYLDLNKVSCNTGSFSISNYTNSYLKLLILSGVIIFICLNQFWLSLVIQTPKQLKYLTKDQEGNTISNLKENSEQISIIKPNFDLKHNIYKKKQLREESVKQQKIQQKIKNNPNDTQQDLIIPKNQQNVLSNIKIDHNIIETNNKNSKSSRSQQSNFNSKHQMVDKKYEINKQNDPKSNVELVKKTIALQKQQTITFEPVVLTSKQEGISPLQDSEEIFRKDKKNRKKNHHN